jgi:hypothetical protein
MSPRFATQGRRAGQKVLAAFGLMTLVGGAAAVVAGCPIYSSDSCAADPSCQPATAYPGTDAGGTDAIGSDGATSCASLTCAAGYACDTTAATPACVPADCRATEKACTSPQVCSLVGTVWTCTTTTPTDCATTGCIAGYTCAPGTAGSRICVSTDPNACVADGDCTGKTGFGAGSLCLGGVCKAPKDLCNDQSQCVAGDLCVNGRCVPSCGGTSSASCVDGYTCDASTGACTGGAGACSATSPCGTGLACVAGRCVDKAQTNGTCPSGEVSVAGGCVINDQANFFCDKSGTADGTQDVCATGSICLHHSCYISCTGASDMTSCNAVADHYPLCKATTTEAGASVFVCGSSTNLGTDCDPTSTPPKTCAAGKVCIDGFCK